MGLCSTWCFGSFCFVNDWVLKLLLFYTEAGRRKTVWYQDKRLMTGKVVSMVVCNVFFSDAKTSLLCFQVNFVEEKAIEHRFEGLSGDVLPSLICGFPLRRFTTNSLESLLNCSGQDWRKRFLQLWEKDWNTWRVEKFFVFILQKFWLFQLVCDMKL